MNRMKKYSVLLRAVLVMALWGSLFPMVKIGYQAFELDTSYTPNVLLFAGIRFIICGSVITLFAASKKKRMKLTAKRELPLVVAVGIFSIILHYTCTYTGLTMADSSVTALLKQLGAFVFIPVSFLFFKEDKFTVKKLIGAICGFGGIVVLNFTPTGFRIGVGEILIILASLCSVMSNIFSKNAMKTVDSLVLTGYPQLMGGIVLFLGAFLSGGRIAEVSPKAIFVLAYICTASILAYCIWNHLVKDNDLSGLLIVKFLEPVFAAVFGAVLLGEDIFNIRFLLALVFIGIAVAITNRRKPIV